MPQDGFKCKQCGHCCLDLSDAFCTCVSEEDVQKWVDEGRDDILQWVVPIVLEGEQIYDIWISPRTGDDVERCPWLRKLPGKNRYICRIHDAKPEHCRIYPQSREHAEKTGCPGFDE